MADFLGPVHVQCEGPFDVHIDQQEYLYPQLGSHSAARLSLYHRELQQP